MTYLPLADSPHERTVLYLQLMFWERSLCTSCNTLYIFKKNVKIRSTKHQHNLSLYADVGISIIAYRSSERWSQGDLKISTALVSGNNKYINSLYNKIICEID